MYKALLFDIDGTLLSVNRSFVHKAILNSLSNVGAGTPDLSSVQFAGRTDRSIFSQLLPENHEHLFDSLKSNYIKYMLSDLSPDHLTLLPKVKETIEAIPQMATCDMGLLTGNFKEVGWHKVAVGGLKKHFTFGSFGCNDHTRADLVLEACHKLIQSSESQAKQPEDIMIIGDTPNDIRCAKLAGAQSVGIATGTFSKGDLKEEQPDYILDSMQDLLPLLNATIN
jgi:phosphoglycolate phosphatase-like HAD superfamily hydrolase